MSIVIFYFFVFLALASAFIVVTTRNVVHSAFALMVTLFSVSVFYVFLDADFLAAIQLLVYVGGILVLVLFGVMMTSGTLLMKLRAPIGQLVPALVVGVLLLALLLHVAKREAPWSQILLVEGGDDVRETLETAKERRGAAFANIDVTTIHPRLIVRFTATEPPPVSPVRSLYRLVESTLIDVGLDRVYALKTVPDPEAEGRYDVIVERRITSLIDGAGRVSISKEEADRVASALSDNVPEGFSPPELVRPPLLLVKGVDERTRVELLNSFGLRPVEDLRTVVGLGDAVMMGEFLLPFEVVGLILLVGLIGAALISRKGVAE